MNVIIDTEVLIWIQTRKDGAFVSPIARQYLANSSFVKWISEVSLFEIAIKQKIGKLQQFNTTLTNYTRQVQEDGFRLLPIRKDHIIAYDKVPFFEDHRDPFDRLILATALQENWPVISADAKFSRYKDLITVLW